jgi:hypothetical protein
MGNQEAYENLMEAFATFKKIVRSEDNHLYERWKAGGFLVDENTMSMYPNATEVYEQLPEVTEDAEEDDE